MLNKVLTGTFMHYLAILSEFFDALTQVYIQHYFMHYRASIKVYLEASHYVCINNMLVDIHVNP